MNIIVFEDAGATQLFPITTGKPAYAITCASFRLADWLADLDGNLVGLVRPYLETLQLHDFAELSHSIDDSYKTTWLINARLVPSVANIKRLHQFKDATPINQTTIARIGWAVASAVIPTAAIAGKSSDECRKWIERLGDDSNPNVANQESTNIIETELELYSFPHDAVDQNVKNFHENLAHRISVGKFRETDKGVHLGSDVKIGDHAVFDSSRGPIVIEDNTKIGPFTFFRGPLYIGRGSKVNEHAAIKDKVSIAHTCKIGGEVEASVIEAYSNKQHHGFLGHSYLGSWINLGAGTCNSDLKNTYGTVNAIYGDRKTSTGMQFFGCVMGDYAKTAINTGVFTGKIVGTGSMIYGFATTNVPSFVNYARSFGEMGVIPPEVIISTQARMFARRDVSQRPCDVQLVQDMFRLTESERPPGLSNEPVEL